MRNVFRFVTVALALTASLSQRAIACDGSWSEQSAGGLVVEVRSCSDRNQYTRSGYHSSLEVKNPYSRTILVTIEVVDDSGRVSRWTDWPVNPGGVTSKSIDAATPTWRLGGRLK